MTEKTKEPIEETINLLRDLEKIVAEKILETKNRLVSEGIYEEQEIVKIVYYGYLEHVARCLSDCVMLTKEQNVDIVMDDFETSFERILKMRGGDKLWRKYIDWTNGC